jgi:hypothetical protein
LTLRGAKIRAFYPLITRNSKPFFQAAVPTLTYSETLLAQVRTLIEQRKPGAMLEKRYRLRLRAVGLYAGAQKPLYA